MNANDHTEVHFRVLRLLEADPTLSQRDIARELNVSLGRINYVLRALVDKGEVKIRNFRNSNHKLRYAYVLTPKGMRRKARLTVGFLQRKLREYETLRTEIETLQRELDVDTDLSPDAAGPHGPRMTGDGSSG